MRASHQAEPGRRNVVRRASSVGFAVRPARTPAKGFEHRSAGKFKQVPVSRPFGGRRHASAEVLASRRMRNFWPAFLLSYGLVR